MKFKNTYIKLKDSDKTVERIKEIADKYSRASGCELEEYLFGSSVNDWYYVFLGELEEIMVTRKTFNIEGLQEITEQDLDNYLLAQIPNGELDKKECCEGVVSTQDDDILNDVTKWACFQQVADVIGEEDAEFELNKVDSGVDVKAELIAAFSWLFTPQGDKFWRDIDRGNLPKEYKQKPLKPTLIIDDEVVNRMKESFNEDFSDNGDSKDTIGHLVEKLYTSLPSSDVTISVNGTGQITLHGNNIPTVDVSKLESDEITKAYEAMVMLEGLFVGFKGEQP